MTRKKQPDTVASVWGLRCPHCRKDDHLEIKVICWATLGVDGTNSSGDHDWDDDSGCICAACDLVGSVAGFMIDRRPAKAGRS